MKIDFGVRVPVSGPLASRENVISSAEAAENLGFRTVWVHDQITWSREQNSHHVSSGSVEAVVEGKSPDFFESITTLSYLAGVTSSVRLGIAVVVLPLRNPVILAKQLMNVDVMSKGRLVIGVGAGAPLVGKTFEVVGVPFEKRGEITDDYLKAMLAVFERRRYSSYVGKFSSFKDAEIFPKPVQVPHPPIVIGGLGRALRRAALYGDGWIPANITPENVKKGISKIRSVAKKNGRHLPELLIGNEIFASIHSDSNVARKNASATIASYAKSIGRGSEDVTLLGSPSEITRKVEAYVQSGVNVFELKFIYRDMDSFNSQLRLFASEILPSFS
ncbi:MAG: LLM class flavin-dependent oxidoreductase [Thaumarchaeota archaeon]|nr:LLM class flavin-dependent oxidoreductase [Nitrososphaerota archaeon]